MKKYMLAIFILGIMLTTPFIAALSASEAKAEWLERKVDSVRLQETHRDAKTTYQADKTYENEQEVIDTGKEVLYAALDEAEAWLVWKKAEADENRDMPTSLRSDIKADVDRNIDVVDELRSDVEGVTTRLELGLVFLKMIGKYLELVVDVARNSGRAWVHIANEHTDKLENWEAKIRDRAEYMDDNDEIISSLDKAKANIADARTHIDGAETYYKQVYVNSTPLINFARGNQALRSARIELLSAHANLRSAFHATLNRIRAGD